MKSSHELVAAAKAQITEVSVAEAQAACDQADVILDVREPSEYLAGHIEGAVSVPRGLLEFKIDELPAVKGANTAIVLYCKTSGRAALAAQSLQTLGYTHVVSITGGFEAWLDADMPIVIPNDDIDFD